MADVSIIAQWIGKADKDLAIAEADVTRPERAEYVAFNCQQAAEKYLKAYIIANNLKFRYTHDLVELLRICLKNDPSFSKLSTFVEELTPFYIESRYPEFVGVITQKRARIALKAARTVANFVKGKLQ